MGPKPDKKAKKEIFVDGRNVAAMTDEQLLEFQKAYKEKLLSHEKETALLEVEVNMLRNAWKTTEDRVSNLEMENVIIRRDLDLWRREASKESPNREKDFDRGIIYDQLARQFDTLDETAERDDLAGTDWLDFEDGDEYYDAKPNDMENRYEADKRHIDINRRLKKKKDKLDEKVKKLIKMQEEAQKEADAGTQSSRNMETASSKPPTSGEAPKDNETADSVDVDVTALEQEILANGSITSGASSDETFHSTMNRPNIVDVALDNKSTTLKPTDVKKRQIRQLALTKERQWTKYDPRYDDDHFCTDSPSDVDHLFDDYVPIVDENVDDAVHFYQMGEWLKYDVDNLEEEMRSRADKRMKALNRVWREDVKNALCAQLKSAEQFNRRLVDETRSKIDDEMKRCRENEVLLKMMIKGLEVARVQMTEERIATNMEIDKRQTEELNYLIQESYDRTINELKESNEFNFNLSQMFFVRSTENDVALIHELHAEQKRVEENVDRLKRRVDERKLELIKLSGPLEEEEKKTKWMETAIAALQKDAKSKREHEKTNERLRRRITSIDDDAKLLEKDNWEKRDKLRRLKEDFEEISDVRDRLVVDNAFVRKIRKMTTNNERKIVRLKRKLKNDFDVRPAELRKIRKTVKRTVERGKNKRKHNLVETKAFNELITQFDLRARDHRVEAFVGIDKLAINYRKTSANVITTFDDDKKIVFPVGGK